MDRIRIDVTKELQNPQYCNLDVLSEAAEQYLEVAEVDDLINELERYKQRKIEDGVCPRCLEDYLEPYEAVMEDRGEHFGFPAKETITKTVKCTACGYEKEV